MRDDDEIFIKFLAVLRDSDDEAAHLLAVVYRGFCFAHQTARFAKATDFSVRWDDDIWQTLKMDEEDVENACLPVMAWRAGRSLDKTRENPWAGKVETAGDLVRFLNAQPRLAD